jgi:hypothetical protein
MTVTKYQLLTPPALTLARDRRSRRGPTDATSYVRSGHPRWASGAWRAYTYVVLPRAEESCVV